MGTELSPNAQAILLLTAPLIAGRGKSSVAPLSAGEYRRLARRLRDLRRQPADLLNPGADSLLKECGSQPDATRLERLLGRGFLLGEAVERWRTRAIWIVSRADPGYPRRLKKRLGENAPPVLYGCGDASILDTGGLAVVGSRNADDTLIEYTEDVGKLTAAARRTVVSGGARGIDQAAMRGALGAGGVVVGVLADGLERAAVRRAHREALMNRRLALICPYDPAARFNTGHAMQRNKLIYALADAALVVSSDYESGGTWAGASEQLEKLRFVSVHVRADGDGGRGLDGLRKRGAKPWPNPKTREELEAVLDTPHMAECGVPEQMTLSAGIGDESGLSEGDRQEEAMAPGVQAAVDSTPAEELFAKVSELLDGMAGPRTVTHVVEELRLDSKKQAEVWLKRFVERKLRERFERASSSAATVTEIAEELRIPNRPMIHSCLKRLVDERVADKSGSRPSRYHSFASIGPLFDQRA